MKESAQDVIELQDTDPILFKYILDYLYGVQIEVPSSNVISLLGLANCYSMEGLRDRLAEILGDKKKYLEAFNTNLGIYIFR